MEVEEGLAQRGADIQRGGSEVFGLSVAFTWMHEAAYSWAVTGLL